MQASLRQRSVGSWELRVFVGVDPLTKRRRYRSMTLRGSRVEAERELAAMVASVRATRAVRVRSTVSELLEAWVPDSVGRMGTHHGRRTRSVLDRYLNPRLGAVVVGDVTPAMIDAVYAALSVPAASKVGHWRPGHSPGFTWCCEPRSRRRCGGAGSGATRPSAPSHRDHELRAATAHPRRASHPA